MDDGICKKKKIYKVNPSYYKQIMSVPTFYLNNKKKLYGDSDPWMVYGLYTRFFFALSWFWYYMIIKGELPRLFFVWNVGKTPKAVVWDFFYLKNFWHEISYLTHTNTRYSLTDLLPIPRMSASTSLST